MSELDYFDFADYISEYESEEFEEFKTSTAEFTLGIIEALRNYDADKLTHCIEELAFLTDINFDPVQDALLIK